MFPGEVALEARCPLFAGDAYIPRGMPYSRAPPANIGHLVPRGIFTGVHGQDRTGY